MDGRRLERQLHLTEGLSPDIREAARENMRSHYSKWANLYLKNGEYAKAREAVSTAAKYDLTPGIALKWPLAHFAPPLGRKLLTLRDEREERHEYGINWCREPEARREQGLSVHRRKTQHVTSA